MYTSVSVQCCDRSEPCTLEGHAYDVSESGVRIELDEPIQPGERVAVCLRLPGENSNVFAVGRVVWLHDELDDPGARRMAVRFTRFLTDTDRVRLLAYLGSPAIRLAA
jgi:hypothetical protein